MGGGRVEYSWPCRLAPACRNIVSNDGDGVWETVDDDELRKDDGGGSDDLIVGMLEQREAVPGGAGCRGPASRGGGGGRNGRDGSCCPQAELSVRLAIEMVSDEQAGV